MRVKALLSVGFVAAATLGTRGPASSRPAFARSTWDSVYTDAQATRGDTVYQRACVRCHGPALTGVNDAAPLTGPVFMSNWNGTLLEDLYEKIRNTMPSDSVGTVKDPQIVDVLAYLLRFDGFPAGKTELPADRAALKDIRFDAKKPGGD
jgi:mono/diheme cytochrome c family protein